MALAKIFFTAILSLNFIYSSPLTTMTSLEELKPQIEKALKKNSKHFKVTEKTKQHFIKRYFEPWEMESMSFSSKEAQWGNGYKNKKMYTRSAKRMPLRWFENQINQSNFEKYNTLKEKAITVKESELKVFPTEIGFYKNPSLPGEGYPFDYNTNSAVKMNLPLFVSHYSKDKKWVYVESSTASGWLKREDIAFVDENFIKEFKTGEYCISTRDDTEIKRGQTVFDAVKMGTLFPKKNNKLLTCDKNGRGISKIREVDHIETVEPIGLKFNYENILKISENLLNEPYGWGGKDGLRDCSLLTKDFMSGKIASAKNLSLKKLSILYETPSL